MASLFRIFGKGVLVILPFSIVIWLLVFLFGMLDGVWNLVLNAVRWAVNKFSHEDFDVEVPSIVVSACIVVFALIFILFVGYRFEKQQNVIFVKLGEWIVSKIPVLGSIYYTIKDLTNMVGGGAKDKYLGVAFVDIGGGELLGFITREDGEYFWVFCPLSPPTSGLLLHIHKDKLKKSNMSVSDGLKSLVSFGVK